MNDSTEVAVPELERLSKYQRWDLGLKVAGWIVSAAALFFVSHQVANLSKQTDRQTLALEAQVWQAITQQQIEISKVMVQYPELLPYFEAGKALTPNDKNSNRVIVVADLYLDFIDGFDDKHVRSLSGMEDGGKYWLLWQRYFQSLFAKSPALCSRLAEVTDVYTKGVGEYAQKGCKEKTSNPAVHTDANGDKAAQRR